jgi:putative hydrolase of the HAD superfamily
VKQNAPGMAPATRLVTLDALGTLLALEPPWLRLDRSLTDGLAPEQVEAAFRAEMAYYRDHAQEGRDAASLAELRSRCARLLSDQLGRDVSVAAMMEAIRFRAFPDAEPALRDLRDRGIALVCVSNWDITLPNVLVRARLAGFLDGVVSSASVGARKPDPAIFDPALELAGCEASEALHVGDTPEEDLAAARGAGIRAILIARDGSAQSSEQAPTISSLAQISDYLAG